MPHILIECSANVADHHDIDALVAVVHEAALATGALPIAGLRTRAQVQPHYRIATGDSSFAFIAINARVAPGRALDVKKALLGDVLDAAEAHVKAAASPLAIAWSVELAEIDAKFRVNRNHIRPLIDEGN